MVVLFSVFIWAAQHMAQVETRTWWITRLSAKNYYTLRYIWNLSCYSAITYLVAVIDSEIVYTVSSTVPSIVIFDLSFVILVAILFIPGSPMSTNAKIAGNRHNDDADGQTLPGEDGDDTEAHRSAVDISTLCKLTSMPQFTGTMGYIVSMLLVGNVRRSHIYLWAPQLVLLFAGIVMQLRRFARDPRYTTFLECTHPVPFVALCKGTVSWTSLDTVSLTCGLVPGIVILAVSQCLPEFTAGWLVSGCIVEPGEGQRCQIEALVLVIVYIGVLVISAEIGQRCGLYLLPTGASDRAVTGKKVIDIQGAITGAMTGGQGEV